MKIKTSEATPLQVNYLVAQAEGQLAFGYLTDGERFAIENSDGQIEAFMPSSFWVEGGPIIEREKISIEYMVGAGAGGLDVWVATRIRNMALSEECAPTPLLAAMRCYAAAMLGDEVDVPDELVVTK